MQPLTLTPTDFIATTNQILETSYGFFYIEGELSQFRISKNKWVYFDIKDENAKVSCFGSVYMLPGPLEDGMIVRIGGSVRMHPQYGFSFTAQSIQPVGQGSLHQALALLTAKLEKEGLFAPERKRFLPHPPKSIALVASVESAAYADFIKIANARWPYCSVIVYDTLVQGENAPQSLVSAIQMANATNQPLADVLVMTRGGGSADDLAAFNDERVVRAIASSRIPTLVAIGHEVDESLAELAADKRASTPSNAAELLLPDKAAEQTALRAMKRNVAVAAGSFIALEYSAIQLYRQRLHSAMRNHIAMHKQLLNQHRQLIASYNPAYVLARGYAIVHGKSQIITTATSALQQKYVTIQFSDDSVAAEIKSTNNKGDAKK